MAASAFDAVLAQLARTSASMGFQGLLVPTQQLPELSQTGKREWLRQFSNVNQLLVGFETAVSNQGLSPRADIQRELDALTEAIDNAVAVRCPLLCVDLGQLPPSPIDTMPPPPIPPELLGGLILPPRKSVAPVPAKPIDQRDSAFESTLDDALRALGSHADRAGCQVAFRSTLGSHGAILRTLQSVSCPWFGVDLDPICLLSDDQDLDAIFSSLGKLVRHVRVKDGVRGLGSRVQTCLLGEGKIDFAHVVANLISVDYRGPLTVDVMGLPNPLIAASLTLNRLNKFLPVT